MAKVEIMGPINLEVKMIEGPLKDMDGTLQQILSFKITTWGDTRSTLLVDFLDHDLL